MPPKKVVEEEKIIIGRPGNHVKCGIVGMPNVGKSSLFNCLSNLNVPAENFPFCTIDPSVAKVPVPDPRHDWLVECYKPKKSIPAVLDITDIAGLVKGAAEGKGLGNAFLSHINAVDCIYHLTRAFPDKEIEHVEGSVDPVRDLDIISEELRKKDLAKVEPLRNDVKKNIDNGRNKTKEAVQELATYEKCIELLAAGKDIRLGNWDNKDIEILNEMYLLSSKPVVYLVNISKKDFLTQKNKHMKDIMTWCKSATPGAPVIPFSLTMEQELGAMDAAAAADFCKENKVKSMLPKIITTGYHALDLYHFFTAGDDEVRAWTIRRGTKAPGAAGVIHSDFEKFFIMAECMSYEHLVEFGNEMGVKKAGKYRQEGKNYVMADGDVVFFKHNAGGAKKK